MRFNINPSFCNQVGPIADNNVSTAFALVGTLQFKEAHNSGYFNFKREDLINAAIPIIQKQALILYHLILFRYAFAHSVRGNFIDEKYYNVTPDCFIPSMEEIQYYLNDPKGIFRFSAKNYYEVIKLFDNKVHLVDIEFPIVTCNKDRSSILSYIEPKMGKFRKNFKKTFALNLHNKHYKFNIKKLRKFYERAFKFKLNKYESLEFLFTDDFYLHEMLPHAHYEDFFFNIITGQCDYGLCGLRQDEIYFKNEKKNPLKASFYLGDSIDLGDDTVIKNLRRIVDKKKLFFKIKHELYQSSSWVDKAFQEFSNNPYHFYKYIVTLYGKEASFEKFLTYDKSTRTYIRTGWKVPCTKLELEELIGLYNSQLPSFYKFSNYHSFRMSSAFHSVEWLAVQTKIQKLLEIIMKDFQNSGDYKKILASKKIKSLGKIPDLSYYSSKNELTLSAPVPSNLTVEQTLNNSNSDFNFVSSAPIQSNRIQSNSDSVSSSLYSVYVTAPAASFSVHLPASTGSSLLDVTDFCSSTEDSNIGVWPSSLSPIGMTSASESASVSTYVSTDVSSSIATVVSTIVSAPGGSNIGIAPVSSSGLVSMSTSESSKVHIENKHSLKCLTNIVQTPKKAIESLKYISDDSTVSEYSAAPVAPAAPCTTITGSSKNVFANTNPNENNMTSLPVNRKSFIVHSITKDPSKIVPWNAPFDPQSKIKSISKVKKKNEIAVPMKLKTVDFGPQKELNEFDILSKQAFYKAAELYKNNFSKHYEKPSTKIKIEEDAGYPFPFVRSIPVMGKFSLPKYIYVKSSSNVLPSSDLKLSFHPYICCHNIINCKEINKNVPIYHKRIVFPIKEFYCDATTFADSYKHKSIIPTNDNNFMPVSIRSSSGKRVSSHNYDSYSECITDTAVKNSTSVKRKMIKRIGTAGKVVTTRNVRKLDREMKRDIIKRYGRSVFRFMNKDRDDDDDDNLTEIFYEESRYINKYDFTKTLYKGFANNKFYYVDVDTIQIEIINEITSAFEDYKFYNDTVIRYNEAFDGEFCYGESYPIEIYEDSVYRPDKISLKIIPFPTANYNTSAEFRKAIAHYLTLYFVKHEPDLVDNNEKYYQSRIGMQYQSELHSLFVYMVALDRHISELYMAYQYIFKIQGVYDHVINYEYEIKFIEIMKKIDIRHARNLENENNLFNEYIMNKRNRSAIKEQKILKVGEEKRKVEREGITTKNLKEPEEDKSGMKIDCENLYSKTSCNDDKFDVFGIDVNDENEYEGYLKRVTADKNFTSKIIVDGFLLH